MNFVKASASNSRLFSKLCSELDASNNILLFHTDVKWLSRDKLLKCVFDLCDELKTFLNQKSKPQFEALFSNKNQLHKIAYLVDIFAILHELDLSLQGPNATCLDLSEKLQAFQLIFQLWQKKLDENRIYMFLNLSAFFEENDIKQETTNRTILSVKEHLKILEEISRYFSNLLNTPFALLERHSPSKLKMFLRMHKRSSLNSLPAMQQKLIILQRQLPNFGSRVCSHILFCLRSHCA